MSTRAPGVHLAPRRVLPVSLLLLVLAGAGLVVGLGHHAPVAHASGGGGCCYPFTHIATATNSGGDWTRLDGGGNFSTQNVPDLLLSVTPNWGGVYDNHPIGVFYSGTSWYIFNQDLSAIPSGAAFNVYPYGAFSSCCGLIQTATSANSSGNATCLNSPGLNENPAAQLIVTPNWNPGGAVFGVYDNHPIGVYYNGLSWCIFNQDRAAMPNGAAFNVVYGPPAGDMLLQTATSTNSAGDYTCLDVSFLNNDPNNILLWVTPNWNPGGVGGVYENHPIGVWYNSMPLSPWRGHWCLFNQDLSAIPTGATFNVLAFYL